MMLSFGGYIISVAFISCYLSAGTNAYATANEFVQRLTEVNQPQLLVQQPLKFGIKTSPKSKKPENKTATIITPNAHVPGALQAATIPIHYNNKENVTNKKSDVVSTLRASTTHRPIQNRDVAIRSNNLNGYAGQYNISSSLSKNDKHMRNITNAKTNGPKELNINIDMKHGMTTESFMSSKEQITEPNLLLQGSATEKNDRKFPTKLSIRAPTTSTLPINLLDADQNENETFKSNALVVTRNDFGNNRGSNNKNRSIGFEGAQPQRTTYATTTLATIIAETNSSVINANRTHEKTNTMRSSSKWVNDTKPIIVDGHRTMATTTTITTPAHNNHIRSASQFPATPTLNIFWQFLNGPFSRVFRASSTTKRPPKKYKSAPMPVAQRNRIDQVQPKKDNKTDDHQKLKPRQAAATTTAPIPTSINSIKSTDGPFRIALPTKNHLLSNDVNKVADGRDTIENLRNSFNCPRESEVRFQLFPKICKTDDDCKVWNREELCCDIFGAQSCVSGIPKPLKESPHAPILGLIPRKCPNRPLAELWWDVTECETDMDCWPRVCCPDGRKRYCRTSQPELDTIPFSVQRSISYLSEYLECTPPPPPIFDIHPKVCKSTFDCFPNVCCQEAGLRHCRPPKKSLLAMLGNVFNVDFVRRLTKNIVIK